MTIQIVTADERRANASKRGSVLVLGKEGVGKTSLLYTLEARETLALDFESGFKSVQTWEGDSIELKTFLDAADVACLIGGGNPALPDNDLLSKAHFAAVKEKYKSFDVERYKNIFFDSVSELSFVGWQHARQQPRAFNQHGVFDGRCAYGVLAENMLSIFRHMQHSNKNIFFVGKLGQDDKGAWVPLMEGAKTGREMLYIVDQVVSMSFFDYANGAWTHNPIGGQIRAFCCRANNPFGLPGKERTLGNVELIEEPHLGKLITKINAPAVAAASQSLKTAIQ